MSELLAEAKEWVSRVIPYSLPIKLIVGALFAILGGSGLLGVLSEFATYSYALAYGFRPPVEGIPYLRAFVTFISIFLLLGSVFGFFLIYSMAKMMVVSIESPKYFFSILRLVNRSETSFVEIMKRIRNRPTKHVVWTSLVAAAVVGALPVSVMYADSKFESNIEYVYAYLGVFTYSFAMYLTAFRPTFIKYIAGVGVIVFLTIIPALMFHTETYTKFMRVSGFGGGKGVSVSYEGKDVGAPYELISGGLLIRTADFIVLYVKDTNEIAEIPMSIVKRITYLNTKDYVLPEML